MPEEQIQELQPEVVQPTEPEAVSDTAPESEQEEKKKNGVQRRFDKMTARIYSQEAVIKSLQERLDQREAQEAQAKQSPAPDADPKPLQEHYSTHEEWVEAMVLWGGRKTAPEAFKTLSAKEQKEAEEAEQKQSAKRTFDSYWSKVNQYLVDHPDYLEDLDNVQLSNKAVAVGMQNYCIQHPNGPALADYISHHPEFWQKLDDLSPEAAVGKIGALADRLFPESSPEAETPEIVPTPKPKPAPPAPAPISPVKKVAPTVTGLSDDLPQEEWLKRRNAQVKAAGRNL